MVMHRTANPETLGSTPRPTSKFKQGYFMKKILAVAALAVLSTLAQAKPTEDTLGRQLREALSDSKPCWVSSWGKTETVYWSKGLKQRKVAEVGDYSKVGKVHLDKLLKACYKK